MPATNKPATKTTAELEIGDCIQLFNGAFGCATVIGKTADRVTVFRPYVHLVCSPVCDSDGKYLRDEPLVYGESPRAIATVGHEQMDLHVGSSATWTILR